MSSKKGMCQLVFKILNYQTVNIDHSELITHVHMHGKQIYLWVKFQNPMPNGVAAIDRY